MGAWTITVPIGTEDANTLHGYIQETKIDVMERMRVTNSDGIDEHIVYDASATGRHPLSKVDFACIYVNLAAYVTGRINPLVRPGTLHFDADTHSLYVGRAKVPGSSDPLDYIELITTTDHGHYTGLDADDHTQYLLKDGTRVMTGDLTIDMGGVLTVTTIEVADDQPISSDHATQSWYDAHGANAIDGTLFAAASLSALNVSYLRRSAPTFYKGGTTDFCIAGIMGWIDPLLYYSNALHLTYGGADDAYWIPTLGVLTLSRYTLEEVSWH